MNYKSTDVNELKEALKNGVVSFEYTKKDGTTRTAKGTLNPEYLPEQIPEKITFDVQAINALMVAKGIDTVEDYARENGLKFVNTEEIDGKSVYVFNPLKRKPNEKLLSYYDIEKDSFRSFLKENFIGIIDL